MPLIDNAKVKVNVTLPPGDSLVGVYPQSLFRIDRFFLPIAPEIELVRGGIRLSCEGQTVPNQSHERTLCVGNFFAFHVRNHSPDPRPFELTVSGPTVDGPAEQEGFAVLGTFAMEREAGAVSLGAGVDYGDLDQDGL